MATKNGRSKMTGRRFNLTLTNAWKVRNSTQVALRSWRVVRNHNSPYFLYRFQSQEVELLLPDHISFQFRLSWANRNT